MLARNLAICRVFLLQVSVDLVVTASVEDEFNALDTQVSRGNCSGRIQSRVRSKGGYLHHVRRTKSLRLKPSSKMAYCSITMSKFAIFTSRLPDPRRPFPNTRRYSRSPAPECRDARTSSCQDDHKQGIQEIELSSPNSRTILLLVSTWAFLFVAVFRIEYLCATRAGRSPLFSLASASP